MSGSLMEFIDRRIPVLYKELVTFSDVQEDNKKNFMYNLEHMSLMKEIIRDIIKVEILMNAKIQLVTVAVHEDFKDEYKGINYGVLTPDQGINFRVSDFERVSELLSLRADELKSCIRVDPTSEIINFYMEVE